MLDEYAPDWFMDRVTDNSIIAHEGGTCHITTLEGVMVVNYGDDIIKGVHGEVYACKLDIFNETYERVGEDVSN